jgi:lysophospholipase L1-like esterase
MECGELKKSRHGAVLDKQFKVGFTMKKYLHLFFFGLAITTGLAVNPPAAATPDAGRYHPGIRFLSQQKEIDAWQGPCQFVFIGDSITEKWDRTIWNERFALLGALNYGIGGDNTRAALHRLDYPGLRRLKPEVAVILIGTNNVSDTASDIAAGVKAIVERTKALFPNCKIILMDILPNGRRTELMQAANIELAKISDGESIIRLDLAPHMVPVGDNWKGLSSDRLHLDPAGYRIWADALAPLISHLTTQARIEP